MLQKSDNSTDVSLNKLEEMLQQFCDSLEPRLRTLSLEGATTHCGRNDRSEPNFAAFGHYDPANLENTWFEIRYSDCVVSVIRKVWTDSHGATSAQYKGYVSELSLDPVVQQAALRQLDRISRKFGRFEIPTVDYGQLSLDFDAALAKLLFKGLEKLGALGKCG